MKKTEEHYPDKKTKQLFEAILLLKNKEEAAAFFRDLLTKAEIDEIANRFQAAKLLQQGQPYAKIAKKLGMSTATVTRVAHWFHYGMGGYKRILDRLLSDKEAK